MFTIEYTNQFKKDLKRYKNQKGKTKVLYNVLNQLRESGRVDSSLKPHMLSGVYSGCIECHIQNDFLLIWVDADNQIIKLIRLGSHAELFK